MKLILPKLNSAPATYMRYCGYIAIENPHKDNQVSYAQSLNSGNFYPRFHAYIEETRKETVISLHLDAKKPSYEGVSAHSGEYEGEIVETEIERLRAALARFIIAAPAPRKLGF